MQTISCKRHHLKNQKLGAMCAGLILTDAYALGVPVIVNGLDMFLLFQILGELLR